MRIINLISQAKVYFSRTASYLTIINFILIMGNFKALYNIEVSMWLLGTIGMTIILLIGYVDYKYIQMAETKYINAKHDLKESLNRIEELIKNGKKE